MLRRVTSSCLPMLLVLGVVASVSATTVPAQAATTPTGVTVFLKAPNLVGLQQLAAAHGLTHAQRVKALRGLLPSAAQRSAAAGYLRNAGFTVTHETAWSVSAAAPAATVDATFGTHAAMRAHATPAQRRAAAGPYPSLPSSLRGIATAAYATSSGPAVFHHNASTLIGPDYRNAYTSADLTANNQAPYSGSDPSATLTIATVQFSSWNSNDLATWANTPGVAVPGYNAANDLTTVPVDQTSVPTPTSTPDGDDEVDLDQEAILSTDPYAHQRPYFAPNTAAGYFDALSQIVDDVTQDNNAYNGGDPRIVAVSTSWGNCESDAGNDMINATEPVLTSLLAAGVTVFASTGDDGMYDDCSTGGANVDYPASSPEVVGVGGTSLAPVGSSAPNNASNWTETAWTCTNSSDCTDNGGTGGGVSGSVVFSGFKKPGYQDAIQSAPYAQATNRMVPDISAVADPATGFPAYTSDPTDNQQAGTGYLVFGGTSLATPVSAALFTNALAAHGATSGVGDIHSALYEAYGKNNGSFRDITSGSNGAVADAGNDPSPNTAVGYDTVTGLGAPLWPKIASLLFSPLAAPTARASLSIPHPNSSSASLDVSASWSGSAAAGGLAVQQASVEITRAGQPSAVYYNPNASATGSHSFMAVPGSTYTLTVIARDLAGTVSTAKTATVVVPIDDKNFIFSKFWKRHRDSTDLAGSLAETAHRHASATVAATGRTYTLVARTGRSYGKLAVILFGSQVRVINLHSSSPGIKRFRFYSAGTDANRTFRFVNLGKTTVDVDGLFAQR
ncbi:MAG: S53 family peptidase [Mycobacteriales bacterium]